MPLMGFSLPCCHPFVFVGSMLTTKPIYSVWRLESTVLPSGRDIQYRRFLRLHVERAFLINVLKFDIEN
jgi:hypothetical protein